MFKILKWLVILSIFLIHKTIYVQSNYTIILKIYSAEVSGSFLENYVILKGHKGTSGEVIINTDASGALIPNFLSRDTVVEIKDKFPEDYGVIESIILGNRGDSLLISFLGIFDATRSLWSNKTLDGPNEGNIEINKSSKYDFPVEGGFSSWGNWTACSTSCGGGSRKRVRLCNDPSPKNGGNNCTGQYDQIEICNNQSCPINGGWCAWSDWSSCSETCNRNAIRTRHRTCECPKPLYGGTNCPDGIPNESEPCNINIECPSWSPWSAWSSCSATCGPNTTRSRARYCKNSQQIFDDDMFCQNMTKSNNETGVGSIETEICLNSTIPIECPIIIDGNWTAWTSWSECTKPCGIGSQGRSRSCTNPAPSLNGKACSGQPSETRDCNIEPCPIHGNWSQWTTWSSCSVTCGNGTLTRTRQCNNPAPANGGNNCSGATEEILNCVGLKKNCPINGNWSDWSNWTTCSATCGMGTQMRYRKCDSPAPLFDGLPCSPCTSLENGTCGLKDEDIRNCSLVECINMQDFTKSILDDALSQLNNTGNSSLSDKDTMKIVFEVVNKVRDALKSQLDSTKSNTPVFVDTPEVSVGLTKLSTENGTTKPPPMKTPSKGGIQLDTIPKNSNGSVAEFSALQSSSFFRSKSTDEASAAMLSLKLGNIDSKTPVALSVSLPNQNQQTESDLLKPISFKKSGKLLQTISYESDKTVFKLSLDLKNATNFTMWFTRSNLEPNTSSDAESILEIFENKTLLETKPGTSNLVIKSEWDLESSMLRITIPSKQVVAGNNLLVMMFTSSTNYTDEMFNFRLGVASMTPREWNYALEVWQDSDVEMSDTSDISNVNFKSNFLGTFSAKIFIPPNTINFKDIFSNFGAKLADSFVVLVVLILLLIAYFISAILCWRKDRQETRLLRYEPLLDNDSEHEYSFIISVFTSPCSDAGTTSDVFVNILGKWGSSGHRKLTDGYRNELFSTGSVCNFVMTTDSSLGELLAMRVWHNNEGRKPSWCLEKIIIEDLQTHKMYIFMCDCWLGEDKFDGKAERVLVEIKRDQSFQNLFYRMKVGGVMDKHVMLSLTRKTGVSNYTRLQKLSVLIAMFFLTMVTNAMFHGKDEGLPAEANFKFDLGIISLTWFEIYTGMISVAITYPAIFLAAEIFRRTKRWRRRWTEDEEAKMKKNFQLPRGFLIIGWMILFGAVGASSFFTFFYSLEWGGEKSNEWLKSFFLGILGMVCLTDPIILLFIYILAKKIFGAVSYDNEMNIDAFVNDDVKQMLGAEMKETDKEKLEKIKKEKENDQKISTTVQDALSYMVYLLLLTALAYDARDQTTFRQNEMLKGQFINTKVSIETYHDIYRWTESVLGLVYPAALYNGGNRTGDLAQAIDICDCQRQGPFRLRQIRVKKNTCTISKWIKDAYGNIPCTENFDLLSKQSDDFQIKWQASDTKISYNKTTWNRRYLSPPESVIDAFNYQNDVESGGFPFEGKFGYYEGGGYVASLGMKKGQAEYVVRNLERNQWIDKLTRAVFFEGTVYNWNTNLFTTIQVLFEVPNSGGAYMYGFGVRSYRLYDYTPGKMIVLLSMQVLYLVVVALTIYREIRKLIVQKCAYFSKFWNQIEMITIGLSICIIITTAVRITLTIDSITKLNTNKGFYVAFDNVSMWVEITCIIMAISSFVSILRVLKYLGFNKHIAVMQATITRSTQQLSSFGVVLICFMIAYLCCGHILFSLTNELFADFLTMSRTLFGAFLGIIPFSGMFNTQPQMDSIIYYYSWTSLSVFFLMSIFVSILNDTYSEVLEEELYDYDRELVEHMWTKFNKMWEGLSNSMKYSVPEVLKKKAIEPVDMSEVDIQMSSRDNLRQFSKKKMNPSLRRKLAELNGDRINQEELARDMRHSNKQSGEEEVYVSPISFTDIQVAASGSQLFSDVIRDDPFMARVPRFKNNDNYNTTTNFAGGNTRSTNNPKSGVSRTHVRQRKASRSKSGNP